MIKARIRWCTCRVENILTLGKLLSLWFCFLLHSILFLISQTSYRTYKIISSYELARPVMGTIFLVYEYLPLLHNILNNTLITPNGIFVASLMEFLKYMRCSINMEGYNETLHNGVTELHNGSSITLLREYDS